MAVAALEIFAGMAVTAGLIDGLNTAWRAVVRRRARRRSARRVV